MENRTVDLESMSPEQVEKIEKRINEKVVAILNQCDADLNRLLNIYGLEAVVKTEFGKKGFRNNKLRSKKQSIR
jgi:hypothetical protein